MDISRAVLLYLCIAIGCLFWNPSLVLGTSKQAETVLNMFNVDLTNYQTLNNFNNSENASTAHDSLISTSIPNRGATIILTLIDGLSNAMGYIILIVRAVFSPVIIMVAGGFPYQITYMLGIPLVVLFIIAVVRFIRGY